MSTVALGSPMEALAINYLSYGVLTAVNNLWAWIAVVTAALSFCWKIKSSTSSTSTSTSSLINSLSPQPSPSHLPQPQPQPQPCTTASNPLTPASSTSSLLSNRKTFRTLESTIGTTSGKFTIYYDDHDHDDDDLIQEEIIYTNRISSDRRLKEEEDGWEAVLRMKTGDMEWYGYQDLTALDGSVVRLWDDALPWSSSSSTIISY